MDKKYPISKQGKKCIGPCYKAGTYIVHPITLEYVTSKNNPFCPVAEYEYINPTTNQAELRLIDDCNIPTNSKETEINDIDFIIPIMDYDANDFLKIYYNIYTYDDTINWLLNNESSIYTKARIIENALNSFGPNLDFLLDNTINKFFIQLIKKEWMDYIFNNLISIYIHYDNEYNIEKRKKTTNNKKERINYFSNKYVNKNIISLLMDKYIEKYKKEWNNISSHLLNIKIFTIEFYKNYLISKLKSK